MKCLLTNFCSFVHRAIHFKTGVTGLVFHYPLQLSRLLNVVNQPQKVLQVKASATSSRNTVLSGLKINRLVCMPRIGLCLCVMCSKEFIEYF